jgi:hypothetical protein
MRVRVIIRVVHLFNAVVKLFSVRRIRVVSSAFKRAVRDNTHTTAATTAATASTARANAAATAAANTAAAVCVNRRSIAVTVTIVGIIILTISLVVFKNGSKCLCTVRYDSVTASVHKSHAAFQAAQSLHRRHFREWQRGAAVGEIQQRHECSVATARRTECGEIVDVIRYNRAPVFVL